MSLESNLHLDGHLKGTILSNCDVSVGHTGRLEGDVKAERVLVSGYVEGCLDCASLEIVSQGRVYGELHSDDFVIEPGGQFLGQSFPRRAEPLAALSHDRGADAEPAPSSTTASSSESTAPAASSSASYEFRHAPGTSETSTTTGATERGTTSSDPTSTAASETTGEAGGEADEDGGDDSREPTRREPRQPVWGRR